MKQITDEEIQQALELGQPLNGINQPDALIYEQLFHDLKTPQAETLPAGFAEKLNTRIRAEQDTRLSLRFYALAVLAVLLIVSAASILFTLAGKPYGRMTWELVIANKWWLLVGLATFLFSKFLEERRYINGKL